MYWAFRSCFICIALPIVRFLCLTFAGRYSLKCTQTERVKDGCQNKQLKKRQNSRNEGDNQRSELLQSLHIPLFHPMDQHIQSNGDQAQDDDGH